VQGEGSEGREERGREEVRQGDRSQRDKKLGPRLFDRALVAAVKDKGASAEAEDRQRSRKRSRH
jgi:hypothetical protein